MLAVLVPERRGSPATTAWRLFQGLGQIWAWAIDQSALLEPREFFLWADGGAGDGAGSCRARLSHRHGVGHGAGVGWTGAVVIRHLTQNPVGRVAPPDMVGRDAELLLPLSSGTRTKVRVQLPDGVTDFVAKGATGVSMPAGAKGLIVAQHGRTLIVAEHPLLTEHNASGDNSPKLLENVEKKEV